MFFLALGVCLVWFYLVLIIDFSLFYSLIDALVVSFMRVLSLLFKKISIDVFFVRILSSLL